MASKEFSQRLKELRIKAGFSQKQVYEHFGIPQSTFSSWEVGKSEPSGEMLIKLCDYYNCDMMSEFKPTSGDMLTYNELKLIEKYRAIVEHSDIGREAVDFIINREYGIVIEAQNVAEVKAVQEKRLAHYQKSMQHNANTSPANDSNIVNIRNAITTRQEALDYFKQSKTAALNNDFNRMTDDELIKLANQLQSNYYGE